MWPVGRRLTFVSMTDPFNAFEPWEMVEDGGLEFIEIGPCIAELPLGDPRTETEDAFILFMSEAWRCLEPGGYLHVSHYLPSTWKGIADPRIRRYLHPETWRYFARPADREDTEWKWRYKDSEIKFVIVAEGESDQGYELTLEKPGE